MESISLSPITDKALIKYAKNFFIIKILSLLNLRKLIPNSLFKWGM